MSPDVEKYITKQTKMMGSEFMQPLKKLLNNFTDEQQLLLNIVVVGSIKELGNVSSTLTKEQIDECISKIIEVSTSIINNN